MINIPALTGAALTNGLNPCGIGMMITFLGYLMIFGTDRSSKVAGKKSNKVPRILLMGVVYIWSVFAAYLLIGLFFYGAAFYLQRMWIAQYFKWIIGLGVALAGLIQLKDAFWPSLPIHLRMGDWGSRVIEKLLSKGVPMAALTGLATTAFSTPCMLPLYVGTRTVLSNAGLPTWQVLLYFIYYNLIFIGPLFAVLFIMVRGKMW
jgi:cytochrome c biogenesis protein CcdA